MFPLKRNAIILALLAVISLHAAAQQAVDSLAEKPASTHDGVVQNIPKVNLSDLQSPLDEAGQSLAEATLVYNTNPDTGKGLYYWNGIVWAQVMADDDGDPDADGDSSKKISGFMESLSKLLGALAWPGTLLLILFLFRSGFSGAIKRLGGFKVDNTGLSVNFNDMIDTAGEVLDDLKEVATAKSGGQIQPRKARSPYVQLINLKTEIASDLDRSARSSGLEHGPAGIDNRLDQLVGADQMDRTKAEMIRTLVSLIDRANRDVTQEQVDRIESMFKEINL